MLLDTGSRPHRGFPFKGCFRFIWKCSSRCAASWEGEMTKSNRAYNRNQQWYQEFLLSEGEESSRFQDWFKSHADESLGEWFLVKQRGFPAKNPPPHQGKSLKSNENNKWKFGKVWLLEIVQEIYRLLLAVNFSVTLSSKSSEWILAPSLFNHSSAHFLWRVVVQWWNLMYNSDH